MELVTLEASSDEKTILQAIDRDGACILSDAMPEELRCAILAELEPFISETKTGRDEFTGTKTQRTGALVARSHSCREAVMNAGILALARQFLAPFSKKLVLNTTQAITINPGEGEQALHRDRLAWGPNIPREIETQLSTIWALSEFTNENGATRVVPGSQHWADDRKATANEICQAEMAPGSVLIFSGSVIHSGGRNNSRDRRIGLNITYCLGWLRQEENQYLSCPPEIARDLDADLQDLLGYTQGDYALGYYSSPVPDATGLAGILPPESAIGRKPSRDQGFA